MSVPLHTTLHDGSIDIPQDRQISNPRDPHTSESTHIRMFNNFVNGVTIGIVQSSARKKDQVRVVA